MNQGQTEITLVRVQGPDSRPLGSVAMIRDARQPQDLVHQLQQQELDLIRLNRNLELANLELDRANRLSEINVVAQVRNVLLSPAYRKAKEEGTAPTVHGWMIDLASGYIREMELPEEEWRTEGLL